MKIHVGVHIAASPADVWDAIQDVESHTEWMRDAVAIRFLGHQRQGAGTRFVCDTKIGPFSLSDVMEITEWSPGQRMGVRHSGLVAGEGAFTLVKVEGYKDGGNGREDDRDAAESSDGKVASKAVESSDVKAASDGKDTGTPHTYFQWEERLRFPWRLGGPITAAAAWPVLRSMWKGNLQRLKSRIENS